MADLICWRSTTYPHNKKPSCC